jgi:membrane protein implicated in regulation of membrane protease activity
MVVTQLQFIGGLVSFLIATWARRKFISPWAKVLLFFVALIAGNIVYLALGIIWALWDPDTASANARAVGMGGWGTLGSTLVAALVGLLTPLGDRFMRGRKGPSQDSNRATEG